MYNSIRHIEQFYKKKNNKISLYTVCIFVINNNLLIIFQAISLIGLLNI